MTFVDLYFRKAGNEWLTRKSKMRVKHPLTIKERFTRSLFLRVSV